MEIIKFNTQTAYRKLQATCCVFLLLMAAGNAFATKATKPKADGEVVFTANPGEKNATFKGGQAITYKINIENSLDTAQSGKVSYKVFTMHDKLVAEDSVKVNISRHGSKDFELKMPAREAGFYKIHLMINVSDYDDTIRRAFGVDPDKIESKFAKPADFDQFWDNTKAELKAVAPNFKVTEFPVDSTKDNRHLYLVEMQSLGNITVRGWLTVPRTTIKKKKFVVVLGLPGYQVNLRPGWGLDEDVAIFYLNVRGQGNSRDVIHTNREDYITYNIGDKNKYVMRGAIMDCVRAVDFIFSRPELDHSKILVTGGSMGGYLTAALAGLDDRVALYSAQNPIYCDIRNLVGEVNWPFYDIKQYAKIHPGMTFDKIMDNLDYYDAKNFATNIHKPIMVGCGYLDNLAPPSNEYVFFNTIPLKDGKDALKAGKDNYVKRMMAFSELGHEVPIIYGTTQGRWMRANFDLFFKRNKINPDSVKPLV